MYVGKFIFRYRFHVTDHPLWFGWAEYIFSPTQLAVPVVLMPAFLIDNNQPFRPFLSGTEALDIPTTTRAVSSLHRPGWFSLFLYLQKR